MARQDFYDLVTDGQREPLAADYAAGPQPMLRMGEHWGDGLSVICTGDEAHMLRAADVRFRQKFQSGPCHMGHYDDAPPRPTLAERIDPPRGNEKGEAEMSIIDTVARRVFRTVIMDGTGARAAWLGDGSQEVMDHQIKQRALKPKLIVMSRDTEREIMREDYSNKTGILTPTDKTQPRRVFGVRIAYDDTLAIGEVLLVEHYF